MGQVTRNTRGIVDTGVSFDCALVDGRWPDFKSKSGGRQYLAAYIAA